MKDFPVSERLVNLIERSADELTRNYMRDVKSHTAMPTYRGWNEKEVYDRAFSVYSQLGKWISRTTTKDEIRAYWTDLGQERRREGFALAEIIQAIHLVRKQLWNKVQSEGFLDSAMDLLLAMELFDHVTQFFDRAVYFTVCGYEGQKT
jgi:hypothetical protein